MAVSELDVDEASISPQNTIIIVWAKEAMVELETVWVALIAATGPTLIGILGIRGANSRLSKQLKAQQERLESVASIESKKTAQSYFRQNFDTFKGLFAATSGLQIIREWTAMMPELVQKSIGDIAKETQRKWEEALSNFIKESAGLRKAGWTLLLPKKLDALIYEVEKLCVEAYSLHESTKKEWYDPSSVKQFEKMTEKVDKKLDELRDQIQGIFLM